MVARWAAFDYTTYNDHTVGWGAFEIFTFQNSKNVQKVRRCDGLVVRVPASRLPVPGLSLDPWPLANTKWRLRGQFRKALKAFHRF